MNDQLGRTIMPEKVICFNAKSRIVNMFELLFLE